MRERHVLRAGLGVDPHAAALRPVNLLHSFAAGHMHDQDWHVSQLGDGDGPVCRFTFNQHGPGSGMKAGLCLALLEQCVGEPADQVRVFGVNHGHGAVGSGQRQQLHDLFVVELHVVVGHVDLERGVALVDQPRQVHLEERLGRVADDQVKSIIDDRFALRAAVVIVHGHLHGHALELAGKGNDGGGATISGGHRAGVEVVSTNRPVASGLIQVAMPIDTTWHDQVARGVNVLFAGGQLAPDRLNLAVGDANIGLKGVGGRNDRAMMNKGIELGHPNSLLRGLIKASLSISRRASFCKFCRCLRMANWADLMSRRMTAFMISICSSSLSACR